MLLLLATAAHAGEPGVISSPRIDSEGFSEMQVLVSAPLETVRALMVDPIQSARLTSDVLDISLLRQDECDHLLVTTSGLSSPIVYQARRCPIPGGWREDLEHSETMTDFASTFVLQSNAEGTLITYRVRVHLDLPVPDWMQRVGLHRSMKGTLENVVQKAAGK